MTDRTQQDSASATSQAHLIRYALELGLLWVDGDGRNKVREALEALGTLETQLESGRVSDPLVGQAPFSANAVEPTKAQIREVFMAHGFTIKEGQTDLKQYVYDAAYALLALAAPPRAQAEECRLVPVDPTPAMAKAAADAWLDCGSRLVLNKAAAAVAAGIAAAPNPLTSAERAEHG